MNLTNRSRYNPCFWTAHWNTQFLDSVLRGTADSTNAREQWVFSLNVKSNRIYESRVANIHFDKGIGTAEITVEAAKEYCKRHFPEEYPAFCVEMERYPETVYLDSEGILTGLEQTDAYGALLRAIQQPKFNRFEKARLAAFIVIHNYRSHAILNSMLEWSEKVGVHKFEHFIMLKHFLSDVNMLYVSVMTYIPFEWRFYRLKTDAFPLTDSPILLRPESVMVALSPRTLLEINRTRRGAPDEYTVSNYIESTKLEEFRIRTIGNTFREIIFGNREVLEKWKSSAEFVERH